MIRKERRITYVLVTVISISMLIRVVSAQIKDKGRNKKMGYCFDAAFDKARNRLFVVGGNFGMHIFDVSEGNLNFVTTVYDEGYYRNLKISGDRAFVADSQRGLVVFDISKNTPSLTWKQEGKAGMGLHIEGNLVFLAGGKEGLFIFDISDPDSPRLITKYKTSGNAWDVWVKGKYAFVADFDSGLSIIDISTPSSLHKIGLVKWARFSGPEIVRGEGKYIYVAAGRRGLVVIDISNPLKPKVVGKFKSSGKGYAEGLCVKNKIVYLANGHKKNTEENGLFIIDAHHPDSLVVRGKIIFPGWVEGVCMAGDYIFITNTYSGVRSIDISDPENPRLIEHFGPLLKKPS